MVGGLEGPVHLRRRDDGGRHLIDHLLDVVAEGGRTRAASRDPLETGPPGAGPDIPRGGEV